MVSKVVGWGGLGEGLEVWGGEDGAVGSEICGWGFGVGSGLARPL